MNAEQIECVFCGENALESIYRESSRNKLTLAPILDYKISKAEFSEPGRILKCKKCDFVFSVPGFSEEALNYAYERMADADYVSEEKGRRLQAQTILSTIHKFKHKGSLLDIGCGAGFFIHEARKSGWEVMGIEPSRWACTFARDRLGLQVINDFFPSNELLERQFDVVVMLDTIEHLLDPERALMIAKMILKDGGILYVSTPDIDSFMSRALGARWWGINPYHLFYFSKSTLSRMLEKNGFAPIQFTSHPRFFSVPYLLRRLKVYSFFFGWLFNGISNFSVVKDRIVKVPNKDQIHILAKKEESQSFAKIHTSKIPNTDERNFQAVS